jgi:hypothetical protein
MRPSGWNELNEVVGRRKRNFHRETRPGRFATARWQSRDLTPIPLRTVPATADFFSVSGLSGRTIQPGPTRLTTSGDSYIRMIRTRDSRSAARPFPHHAFDRDGRVPRLSARRWSDEDAAYSGFEDGS